MNGFHALYALSGRSRQALLLIIFLFLYSCCLAQNRITLHEKQQRIDSVAQRGARQLGLSIGCMDELFKKMPLVDIDVTGVTLDEFFDTLLAGLNCTKRLSGEMILFSITDPSSLYWKLRGRVLSKTKEPLREAQILSTTSSKQAVTRADGTFELTVNSLWPEVEISCFGYKTQQFKLSNKWRHDSDILLEPSPGELDKTVVIGYGNTLRRRATVTAHQFDSTEIEKQPVPDMMRALQWMIPSLLIRRSNGVSGSNYSATLRGRKSITQGNDPLYIIDGVPLPSSTFIGIIGPGSSLGAVGASPLNGIPPGDIASVTVMDGADATAIYGSRGSNGVILITTKQGHGVGLELTGDVYWGLDQAMKISPLLDTRQYLQMKSEAVANDGLPVDTTTVPELRWGTTRSRNFQRLVMGNPARVLNARVGISGGDSSHHYLLSGSLQTRSTVFTGETRDFRQSIYGYWDRVSSDKKLRLTATGLYSWQEQLLPLEDLTSYTGLAPNAPDFYTSDRTAVWSDKGLSFNNIQALTNNTYKLGVYNVLGHLLIDYKLDSWLSLTANLGFYRLGADEQGITTVAGQNPAGNPSASVNLTQNNFTSKIAEVTAQGLHRGKWGSLETVLGASWQEERRDTLAFNIDYETDSELRAGQGTGDISMGKRGYTYHAVFGRATYNFQNKYIATLSGRWDASDRYGGSSQSGLFMSAGGAWVFSQERFIKKNDWFNFGKLRASYGTTGNDQILTLGSPNLRWELNHNAEAGLELGLFKERLLFSAVGYRVWSENQILRAGKMPQSGLSDQPVRVRNEGLEFVLQVKLGDSGSLQWGSRLNITVPRNELVRFPNIDSSAYATSLVVGKSLSVSKGYHLLGVDADSGIYQFQDVKKDGKLDINDYLPSRSEDPRFYGSWNNQFNYKGWQLDANIAFCFGNGDDPLVKMDRSFLLNNTNEPGVSQPDNVPVPYLSHWRMKGDVSSRQRLTSQQGTAASKALTYYLASDANVRDASFIRLKTVSLSRQLPQEWLKRFHCMSARIYVRMQDCATWTHYPVTDPETQDPQALPPSWSWVTGLSISF